MSRKGRVLRAISCEH